MAAQHSQAMERFFYGIPGLLVLAPSDPFTCAGLLKAAVRSNNPVIFFEHKLLYAELGELPTAEYTLPIGKARVVRQGSDVTLVTYLLGVGVARQAADLLAQDGVDVEVIDLLSLYPLDIDTVLASVGKTGRLVTLEEGWFTGSIGSEVISQVALAGFGLLRGAPVKIAAPDCPVPYAKNLETALMPSPEQVAARIKAELRF
jgi:pyruvate/2-oxoglutarate/acetoin dehydrogenase E1 component